MGQGPPLPKLEAALAGRPVVGYTGQARANAVFSGSVQPWRREVARDAGLSTARHIQTGCVARHSRNVDGGAGGVAVAVASDREEVRLVRMAQRRPN